MTSETFSGGLSEKDLQGITRPTEQDKNKGIGKYWPLRKRENSQLFTVSDQIDNTPPTSSGTKNGKEILSGDAYKITDVFPHNLRENPLSRRDIELTIEWAQHPDVAGHIYQLESDTSKFNLSKWEYFLLYYKGAIDDEGNPTDPNDSIFFKGVHGTGSEERMLINSRMRMDGVEFVRSPRTGYWERVIEDPAFFGKKIGLAFGVENHYGAFYKYDGYGGRLHLPAKEMRGTTYADREAKGWEKNEEFLYALGYEHHGDPILVKGRRIQPWRNTLETFEKQLPNALTRISKDQPERANYLVKEAERLQPILHDRLKELGY